MRVARRIALVLAVLAILALATFAIPVQTWRTGQLWAPPLDVIEGGPPVVMPQRVWIDTDAACGHGGRTDPDDCFALLLLARSPDIEIVGVSTVFGNAELDVVDRTTRELMALLARNRPDLPPVHRGSADPVGDSGRTSPQPAHAALRKALAEGPLTIVALGPLTNIAAALDGRPDLQANVGRLLAVMGRRPGHMFHPAEGAEGGMLFGHGPVFRDFNFDMDRAAAAQVVRVGLPTTLVPYEAARQISLTGSELDTIAASGGAASWIADRARGWLRFWKEDIGRNGFYPFDLLAAAYVVAPKLFDCANAAAWVGKDDRLWNLWFHNPAALLVGPHARPNSDAMVSGQAVYCAGVDEGLSGRLMQRLATGQPTPTSLN